MSGRHAIVPESVLRSLQGDASGLAVYVAYALHADERGVAYPLQATVADLLGKSVDTVQRAIERLRARGLMIRLRPRLVGTRKVGNRYRVTRCRNGRPDAAPLPGRAAPVRHRPARDPLLRKEHRTMNTEPPDLELVAPTTLVDVPTITDQVFDAWREATGRTGRTILTKDRRRKIEARLHDGYRAEDLTDAARGVMLSGWHVENGYTDLTTILRDADQVEKFRDLYRNPPAAPRGRATGTTSNISRIADHFGGRP